MDLKALYNKRADVQKALTALGVLETGDDARDLTDDELKAHAQHITDLKAIDAKIARATAVRDAEMAAPSGAAPGAAAPSGVVLGADLAAERPWGPTLHANATTEMVTEANEAALGEWAIAVKAVTTGIGRDPRLMAAPTGMGTTIPSEGGWAVPEMIAPGLEREMFNEGDLLGRVDARTITSDNMTYNVVDETSRKDDSRRGGVRHYWVDQGTAPTASQTKLARMEMKLRKVGALGYMTSELVSDASALGGELRAMFVEELLFGVEDAIFEGDGAGKPRGFTNANCIISVAKETGQAAATIVGENITKMWSRMPPRSQKTAVWLANIDTIPTLSVMTQDIGTAGVRYPYASITDGAISMWGRPVVYTEYNSTVGTVDDLVLADLKKYRLIRKGGIETASSIHVKFIEDEETFRAFYRVDGQAVPRAAMTPFKGTTTVSPFVTLATRS